MDIFRWFYQPAQSFVGEPIRAYVVAGLFAILAVLTLVFRRKYQIAQPLVILGPAPGWALLGWLEHVSQAAQWNIRVDLLVTWPTIVLLSATCLVLWVLGFGVVDTPKKPAS